MSKRGASRVVHCEFGDSQIGSAVNAHELDGRVEVETGYNRRLHAVCVEEFALGLASVASLSIPLS
jgi:hypothetical protein